MILRRVPRGRGLASQTIYTLSPSEQVCAASVGHARFLANQSEGTYRAPMIDKPPDQHERDSVGAEIAFGALTGLPPHLFASAAADWRKSTEFKLPNGSRADVKQTDCRGGKLLVPSPDFDVVYILLVGIFPSYRYIGWATGREVTASELTNPGRGVCYAMYQHNLHKWLSLEPQ